MKKNFFILLLILIFVFSCGKKQAQLDPRSKDFYKVARFFMEDYEEKVFLNLPTKKARYDFIRNFWEIRDPNPMTEVNEYKMEIDRRYEFISRRLDEPGRKGLNTDRGRFYLLLGPPDGSRRYRDQNRLLWTIVWYYDEYKLTLIFRDKYGTGNYDLINQPHYLFDAIEMSKYKLRGGRDKKGAAKPLKFDISYDEKQEKLKIDLKTKNLTVEKDKQNIKLKYDINLTLYFTDKTFERIDKTKTVELPLKKLLEKDVITFFIPLKIEKKGKIIIDVIITEIAGNMKGRKILKFNL